MTDSSRRARDAHRTPDEVGDAFGALTALLWREREILEQLLFRLVEQQLILSAGATRWLPKVDAEVRAAAESLQDHEIVRAADVDLLVQHFGLPADTSLRQLAEVAPEPWPTVLLEHRESLRALTLEIDGVTADNRRMLLAGEQATREALERATGQRPDSVSGATRRFETRGPLRGISFIHGERT